MKKHAKIAALGAISALSMGIFAVAQPVMAESSSLIDLSNPQTSADVTVQLTVVGEAPAVTINKPYDGEGFIGKKVPVSVTYEHATQITYKLIHINEDNTRTEYDFPTKSVSDYSKSITRDIPRRRKRLFRPVICGWILTAVGSSSGTGRLI